MWRKKEKKKKSREITLDTRTTPRVPLFKIRSTCCYECGVVGGKRERREWRERLWDEWWSEGGKGRIEEVERKLVG